MLFPLAFLILPALLLVILFPGVYNIVNSLGAALTQALVADGRVVCPALSVADTAPTRMKGLLGRRSLADGEGLLLRPAGSIHTAFMRFPIDAVFLDADMRVLRIASNLRPWRLAAQRGARAVVELPAGAAEGMGLAVGLTLELAEASLR